MRPVTGYWLLATAVGAAAGFCLGAFTSQRRVEERLLGLEAGVRRLEAGASSIKPPASGIRRGEQHAARVRKAHAEEFRRDYRRLVEEGRKASGAGSREWKQARAVLGRHFQPMEKALQAFETSPGWRVPRIREVVAPRVAGALEELRAALGQEAWKKFDAWRRPGPRDGPSAIWRRPRYAYFLRPEEYEAADAAAAAGLRWNLDAASLQVLFGLLRLPRHEEDELKAILRDHLNRYSAAVGGLGVGGRRPADADARVRAAIELTEKKLRLLLDKENFTVYEGWKAGLHDPARQHFTAPKAGSR